MRNLSDVIFDQHPVILKADVTVAEACERMRDQRVGSVLVSDEAGRLAGIFTGRDAVCRVAAMRRDAAKVKLADVMTADPKTLSPNQSAVEALRLMWDGGFRHVPLVKDGRILGVVSRGDFRGLEYDRLETERDLWEHMR